MTLDTESGNEEGVIAIDSEDAEGLFGALSSATARELLVALYDAPRTPSKLADAADTSLQNVDHHLDQLKAADLVTVVGTDTSGQGREMNRYGPTADSLVLHAGSDGDRRSRAEDGVRDTGPDRSSVSPTGTGDASLGPAARGFVLGLLAAGVVVALARLRRRP
jgi:DNA-binding transcriptional ArsR family regulator